MSIRIKVLFALSFLLAGSALLLNVIPASTQSKAEADKPADGTVIEGTNGKMRRYANEVIRIEPDNFAVTPRLRDLPDSKSYAPDAFKKGGQVIRERRMARLRKEREKKGLPPMTAAEEQDIQLNWRNAKRVKKPLPGEGAGFAEFEDPVLHVVDPAAPQAMPTPSLTFDGAGQADNSSSGAGTGFTPPDVNGDVGPNHYVSSVNLSIKIFNKDGSVAAAAKKTSDLFAALPSTDPCRSRNDGDPIVLYDSLADRWFITQFSIPGGDGIGTNNYECVAVSQTSDPTGSYYVWSYQYPNSLFNDYPKVGIWTDAYHMTFNQFTNAGAWAGLGILSQDRAKALAGDPNATVVYKDVSPIDPNAGGALPADIDGFIPPPAGMAQVIAEFRANEFGDPNDAIRLYRWIPDFTTPANSTFATLGDTVLAAFDARSPNVTGGTIEQAGGTALDGIAERLMFRLAYRNLGTYASAVNSYAGSFTVNVSGVNPTTVATYQTGVRWFELRRTNDTFSVRDQGTHATGTIDGAAGLNNWMSSIAQDNAGNIALGFSQASATQNADIKIAGRTGTSTGAGLNEGEALFWDALGSQNGTSERWGDYSMMSVDPTDDCTFWYTQQYYATSSSSNWSTRVGKFKYPGCTSLPKGTITGTITSCATGLPVAAANVLATGGFHRLTGAIGTYSMTVYPGNYTISADKGIGLTGSSVPVSVTSGGTATANICLTGVAVANAGEPSITSESCGIANGKPDPGEQLTVALPISNTGGVSTTNLVATLQASGGVVASTSQSYGALAPGAAAESRNFTFTVDSSQSCGSSVTLTWVLTDGSTNLGTVTKTYATGTPVAAITENFDSVTAPTLPTSWTSLQTSGTGINWVTSSTSPVASSPNTAFANGPGTVNAAALVTPAVNITGSPASVTFKKAYSLENTYDGAVLEIKIGTGAWQDIVTAGGSFVTGGYISPIDTGYQNPIAGRNAWTGSSTSMTVTEVTLPSAATGQSVQLRWLVATDNSTTSPGFRVDDIVVSAGLQCQSCSASNGSLAGTIRYYGGTQPTVSGVTLTGAGTPQVTATSASDGTYTLSGLGSAGYTVTPSKSGAVNGIASADAARVAQAVVGLVTLTANQQIAADATGNGTVASADAARIAQYIVGLNPTGVTGTWKFAPATKTYTSVTSAVTGEDYAAIMVGDVTGNWTQPPAAGASEEEDFPLPKRSTGKAAGLPGLFGEPMYSPLGEGQLDLRQSGRKVVDVSIVRPSASGKDGTIMVPIKVGDLSGMNVTSFDFALRYDARLLQPAGISGSGALAENFVLTPNFNVPGSIRISGFGIDALSGSGDLVYIVFKVRTRVNPRQPVSWQSFIFNEGEIPNRTRISTESNGTGRNRGL